MTARRPFPLFLTSDPLGAPPTACGEFTHAGPGSNPQKITPQYTFRGVTDNPFSDMMENT